MKREILYRGARMEDGKFVYGSLVFVKENDKSENELPHIVISYGPDTFDWCEVDPETVGQYTGMTDKNGTKIFEGDILKIVTFGFNTDAFITSIIWDRNGFKLANGRNLFYFGQSDYTKLDDSIVIGNIHDNKELLK